MMIFQKREQDSEQTVKAELVQRAKAGDTVSALSLLRSGADPNQSSSLGEVPLMWAAINGDVRLCRALRDAGARIDAAEPSGSTALTYAVLGGIRGRTTLDYLLRHGASARNTGGVRALVYAAQDNDLHAVKALIHAGADVNASDASGNTALMLALGAGNRAVAWFLLSSGADVNRRNNQFVTALFPAVALDDAALLKELFRRRADVNADMGAGNTPLGEAIRSRRSRAAEFLLAKGARVTEKHVRDARGTSIPKLVRIINEAYTKQQLAVGR